MHFAVDATTWTNPRGYGRFTRSLLTALLEPDQPHRYTLFTDSLAALPPMPARATVTAATHSGRTPGGIAGMSRALSARGFDAILFPTVYSYVPVLSSTPKVVVFHDVIAERFPRMTVPSTSARLLWNAKVRLARAQASTLVTVSEYSRRELAREFHLNAATIQVVGEAPAAAFHRIEGATLSPRLAALNLPPRPWIVYAGGFGPHKNVPMLVDAFAALTSRYPQASLILVGENRNEIFHSEIATIEQRVASHSLGPRAVFTGFLPDPDLALLLNLAHVLVLPSLMEGFGLPAVEAAACGCPVIATRESPLPELLSGGGIFIDPHSPSALKSALDAVLASDGSRENYARQALAAATMLTWERSAMRMLDILEAAGRTR
ncbi:MAG: glycosyltransferase family 1 protein [Acidobacteriota bacterium]